MLYRYLLWRQQTADPLSADYGTDNRIPEERSSEMFQISCRRSSVRFSCMTWTPKNGNKNVRCLREDVEMDAPDPKSPQTQACSPGWPLQPPMKFLVLVCKRRWTARPWMTTAYSMDFRQYRQYRTVPLFMYGASPGRMRLQLKDRRVQASLLVIIASKFIQHPPPGIYCCTSRAYMFPRRYQPAMFVCRVDVSLVLSQLSIR